MTTDLQLARFIEVHAGVRYFEDGRLNGVVDTEGKVPLRHGEDWRPTVELATGRVLDWPAGVELETCYKVCDNGEYWLQNESRQRIAKWRRSYVPLRFLDIEDADPVNIAGDYIVLQIGGDGFIANWRNPAIEAEQWTPLV